MALPMATSWLSERVHQVIPPQVVFITLTLSTRPSNVWRMIPLAAVLFPSTVKRDRSVPFRPLVFAFPTQPADAMTAGSAPTAAMVVT